MKILITSSDAAGYFESRYRIFWQLSSKKLSYKIIYQILFLVIGVFFLVSAFYTGYDNKVSNTEYAYGLSFGFGFACIYISLYSFYGFFRQRRHVIKTFKKIYEIYRKNDNNYNIRVTDESLYYQDYQLTKEFKWIFFSHYKLGYEYILLFRDNYLVEPFLILKNQLTSDELAELLHFLKKSLPEKR